MNTETDDVGEKQLDFINKNGKQKILRTCEGLWFLWLALHRSHTAA